MTSTSSPASPIIESQTPGELEGGEMISGGESLKLATRVSELRKSRPGTPRLDSRVGSQVTFALNSDGGNLSPSVP